MANPPLSPRARADLDLLRGAAALFVVATHVRQLMFVPQGADLAGRVFLQIAGRGHDAVLAFFVLSGYLVTRSSLGLEDRRWTRYAVARASRILTVLWPAFVLGVLLDRIGLAFFRDAGVYAGHHPSRVFSISFATRHSIRTVLGNLAFLQWARFPTLGSNVALWTLAYEGWFYFSFPFVVTALSPGAWPRRLLAAAVWASVVALLGELYPSYFAVWSCGAVVALWERRAPGVWPTWTRVASVAGVLAVMVVRRSTPLFVQEQLTGVALALLVASFTRVAPATTRPGSYTRVASALSAISFSLYLVHVPALALVGAWLGTPPLLRATAGNLLRVAPWVALVIAYAVVVYFLIERRTPAVRRWLARRAGLAQGRSQ
ncbi:MAG: acyltransferase [Deltaproteobacteria bacterium]|nr:acyltransferase [Deltaproteobacteria bacterium]